MIPKRMENRIGKLVIAFGAILLLAALADHALAQTFGAPKGTGTLGPPGRLMGWILAKQSEFYRQFSGLLRAAKADGSAVWGLVGVSFLYGVFHAAGPGHGKAVISSYCVANRETWRRGVTLAFASALLQAVVAVAVVGLFAAVMRATASTMRSAVDWIEIASYSCIIGIGLRLLWVKGGGFLTALREVNHPKSDLGAAVTPANLTPAHHDHTEDRHGCAHCESEHDAHSRHGHHHDHGASAWGHAHAPEPAELAGPGGLTRGLSAVVGVGLRPCSGAIIVLVFALAQGLFRTGILATFVMALGTAMTVSVIASLAVAARTWADRFVSRRPGYGALAMRGIETGAAVVIVGFGVLLLTGYIVSERLVGV